MKRTIIKIDEELCNGCGQCVSGCHEGALQLINGKAVMISELYCDGLGACIGDCPVGAIELEEREAEAYDEIAVMERISSKGEKVVLAHLKHLKDHDQHEFLQQGIDYIKKNNLPISIDSLMDKPKPVFAGHHEHAGHHGGGCPGSQAKFFAKPDIKPAGVQYASQSELQQWPVQLHLLSPMAPYLTNADLLLAADCTAFSVGDFHSTHLKGKRLAIACPKLDTNKEVYIDKLVAMINDAKINTLTVMIMEVPCCGGLLQIAQMATAQASRKIPVKLIVVGLQGNIIKEEWV
ncbi:ATP-binding protein [Parabacteroides sp. FAFU027]|uniref:ATP-binding protein n=1 Tax=Parabacteroides sp. FAFU027 TaxID=2922715 RepID=UPI001FB03DF8|nr:4Fe-4S binding protein [Parabacteroides sp. FAFU027]